MSKLLVTPVKIANQFYRYLLVPFNCSVITVLKHEAKKIDNFSKVKFPISVYSVRLYKNGSIKEKCSLHLKKKKNRSDRLQCDVSCHGNHVGIIFCTFQWT